MALKEGMIERLKKALPVLKDLEKDLEWIEQEFSLKDSTEEERNQVKQIRNMAIRSSLSKRDIHLAELHGRCITGMIQMEKFLH